MAVITVQRIQVAARKEEKRKIVEFLQLRGAVEVCSTQLEGDYFARPDSGLLEKEIGAWLEAASKSEEILKGYVEEKKSFFDSLKGRKIVSTKEYDAFDQHCEAAYRRCIEICDIQAEIKENRNELLKLHASLLELSPWEGLPVPLNYTGSKYVSACIGIFPKSIAADELQEQILLQNPLLGGVHIECISQSQEQTCLLLLCLKQDWEALQAILHSLGFSAVSLRIEQTPRRAMQEAREKIKDIEKKIKESENYLREQACHMEEIRFLSDYATVQLSNVRTDAFSSESPHVFLLTGYVLEPQAKKMMEELLARFHCAVMLDTPPHDHNAPCLMKNAWFSEPCESIVSSYAYPAANDVDPTFVMSIFYYLFFGLMFSDAGYGFLLSLSCILLLKFFPHMKRDTNKFLRLFFWCGISTMFWGVVFSSYFGDVVDVFSREMLGNHITIQPLWFSPLQYPMRLFIFCLGLGIIHLVTGYAMNAYSAIKRKDYAVAVYDAGFQVLFFVCLLVVFMGSSMFSGLAGFSFALPPVVSAICLSGAGFSLVGVLLTGGRESRNWFKRILKGIFACYNMIAGWVSDVLSYSRLLALGLATGVIGSVVNTLGAMAGPGLPGMIMFFIAFVLGHSLNFGINILGAYIHSNRLEYVEFLSKFYEGGGKEFAPLSMQTKYFEFKEM